MFYIHCNFPSNIKIAFVITCVKIYCACFEKQSFRVWEENFLFFICSTSREHNFMYLKRWVYEKGTNARRLVKFARE
jgi:hypothetical protein